MNDLLVVGTASLDVLHFGEKTVYTAGGAGMYTALAARRHSEQVTLFGPRPAPSEMPDELQPIAARLDWQGPITPLDQLPRLEIRQHGGGKATLVGASWGAETSFAPADLPEDELALWQQLGDLDSPNHILNHPDFQYRAIQTVFVGCVP